MGIRAKAKYELTATDKTDKAFSSVKRSMGGITSAMGGLKTAIAGAIGVAGFGALIKGALDAGDRVHKLSIRLGASTEFLSRMGHAAELSGSSMEAVAKATQMMQRAASEAAEGVKTYSDAFETLGIDINSFKAASAEDQFLIMTEALGNVTNASDKTKLAMEVMGRSGVEMIQIMAGGSEAIEAMWRESDELGKTLSDVAAKDMAAANDALTRLQGSIQGVTNILAVEFAPTLVAIFDWLKTAILNDVARIELLGEKWDEFFKILKISWFDLSRDLEPIIKRISGWIDSFLTKITNAINAVSNFAGTTNVGAPIQVFRGGRAVGGTIAQSGRYDMHEGERVISNVTNNNVSLNMSSGDMTPAGTRAWVRNVLIPELAAATR